MKKITSVFAAIVASVFVLCSSVLPAFAYSKEIIQKYFDYTDGGKYYVYLDYNDEVNCYQYRYDGGGVVTKWEFVGLEEGVDYEVYAMGEANIAIRYIADKKEFSNLNLTVNFDRWQTRLYVQDITTYVNGLRNYGDFSIGAGAEDILIFTYKGNGKIVGWELPNLTEGVNYKVVAQEGNSFAVKLIDGQNEIPYLNAFVDFGEKIDLSNAFADTGIFYTVPVNIKVESSVLSDLSEGKGDPVTPTEPVTDIEPPTVPATDTETLTEKEEIFTQYMIISHVAVGVCSAALSGIIVFAVMKKKKKG